MSRARESVPRVPTGGRVLGVQAALASPLNLGATSRLSGIRKRAVGGRCAIGPLGLDGDEQADLSLHGGLEKAVYAYPQEHVAFWRDRARDRGERDDIAPGRLGENLRVTGVLESDLFVGDEWHFPDCVLRVSLPRIPCAKLNAVLGDSGAARAMAVSERCGVYLAVKGSGSIEAGEDFTLVPGPRQTPLLALFAVSRLKTRHD